jgi:hypothetical protein
MPFLAVEFQVEASSARNVNCLLELVVVFERVRALNDSA